MMLQHRMPTSMRLTFLVSATIAATIAYGTYQSPDGLPRRRMLQADLARVLADNAALQNSTDRIRREIVAQKDRPEVQEALARSILGWVRPQDIVLRPSEHASIAPQERANKKPF